MNREKIRRISSAVLLVAAVIVFAVSGVLYLKEKSRVEDLKKNCTAQTEGIIVSSDKHSVTHTERVSAHNSKQVKETYYLTKYDYTVDGKKYTLTEDIRTSYAPTVGAMTAVTYDPSDPEKAYTGSTPRSYTEKYIYTLIGSGVVSVFMLITVIRLFRGR